jgi:hypothetical protein
MQAKDYVYIVGILLTFLLGVFNLLHTWRITQKTTFINCVTAERVKWITNLRENIAAFCGLTHHFHWSGVENSEQKDIFKQVDRLRMLIQLQLNPNEERSKKIICLITNEIPNLVGKTGGLVPIDEKPPLDKALDELVSTSQLLLKEEWDRVKEEA